MWSENPGTLKHGVGISGQTSLMVLVLQTYPPSPVCRGGHYFLVRAGTCTVLVDATKDAPPTKQPVPHFEELCPALLLVIKLITRVKSLHIVPGEVLDLINKKSIRGFVHPSCDQIKVVTETRSKHQRKSPGIWTSPTTRERKRNHSVM